MRYEGKFTFRDETYLVSVVESNSSTRYDFFKEEIKLMNPKEEETVTSVFEDVKTMTKEYSGDLDLYYAYERVLREARQFRFNEEDIESYDDFEEGKVIFVCNQKNDRFEYNYKTENTTKIHRFLRTPESTLELNVADNGYTANAKHMTLTYQPIEIKKSGFNEDSLILSRIATLSELREKYDLSWFSKKEYIWIEDIFQLNRYIKEYIQHAKANPDDAVLAIDTETTGLNVYHYPDGSQQKDKLVSIVLSWKDDFSIYIPVGHKYEKNLPEDQVIKVLCPLLEHGLLLTQYGTFDWKVFRGYKNSKGQPINLNIRHDFLLQNYILQPNPRAGSRSLKDKAWELLNIKQLSLTDLFPATKDGGKLDIRFELLPKDIATFYACPDVDLLRIMYKMVKAKMVDVSIPIYNTEVKFMPISASGEYYGLKLNMDEFQFEKKLCEELTHDLQEAIYKYAGYRFNLNSPDQVSDYLYNKLGCEILLASKSNPNKGSTSAKALKNLAKIELEEPSDVFTTDFVQVVKRKNKDGTPLTDENGNEVEDERRLIIEKKKLNKLKYPTVALIVEYRNYSKLLSSFFNSIEESNRGGRLFSWINQTGAQTGRIISPLQTLPPFIKKMIVPDTSEHGFIVMDYKQVELRLMFGLAKEEKLIELSENPDNDIHRIVAALIYNMELWEIYADLRKKSKGLNFGIPYSLGDRSLAETLYGIATSKEKIEANVKKAQEDRMRFFEAMPRVERLFADAKNFVRNNGCLYTMLGRGFFYESIFTETNRGKIARMLRQAGNGMIQGLGADLFKKGTTDFEKRIKARGWDRVKEVFNRETGDSEGEYPYVRQAFFVHDELGTVYHKASIHPCQVLYELRNTMQLKIPGFPTLFIGPAVVSNWGDAKEDKFEIPTALLDKWCNEVEQGMYTEPIDNPEEWIYGEIVKFKTQGYLDYIHQLRKQLEAQNKYASAKEIAKIFRHDTLTHDMIAIYDDKKFEKAFNRKPDHVELVEWAVERYIEDNNVLSDRVVDNLLNEETEIDLSSQPQVISFDDIFKSAISTDPLEDDSPKEGKIIEFSLPSNNSRSEDKAELMEIVDELDEFSNPLDVNVDYVFDDTDDDIYTENYDSLYRGAFSEEEYKTRAQEILEGFSEYIVTVARKKIIKLDNVTSQAVMTLQQYLTEHHLDDGLYDVSLDYNGKIIDTPYKVDKLDDAVIDLLLSKSSEEIDKLWKQI